MAELSAKTFVGAFAQRYAREQAEKLVRITVGANGEIDVRFGRAVAQVPAGLDHAETLRAVADALDQLMGGAP